MSRRDAVSGRWRNRKPKASPYNFSFGVPSRITVDKSRLESRVMRYIVIVLGLVTCLAIDQRDLHAQVARPIELAAQIHTEARLRADLAAFQKYRPAYPFWQHIFIIPDGRIVYGSPEDGRLLATFPVRGDWASDGIWEDPSLSVALSGQRLPSRLRQRRE